MKFPHAALLFQGVAAMATLVAFPATAAPMGVVEGNLARIDLHTDQGPCVGYARRAVFVPKDGKPEITGCWRIFSTDKGQWLAIAFLDGEFFETSALHIKQPTGV